MICIIALVVFGIMAIFSAAYRPLAKEAFDCVFRRVTFRKCRTNLDERIRSRITGRLIRYSPKISAVIYRYFEILSWLFVIITVISLVFAVNGLYNYAVHGNCYGPNSNEVCLYEEILQEDKCVPAQCANESCNCSLEECRECRQCTKEK
ncbi:hypothetical protein HZB88_02740 [archaeon]|nr:hypothetical protein [archaeon]